MGRSERMRLPIPAPRMIALGAFEAALEGTGVIRSALRRSRDRGATVNPLGGMGRKHKLGDLDSNQDKQYQKLLCYRYTIAQ